MEPKIERAVFRDLSYGLYIVTSSSEGRLNGQVVNTVIQVTSDPPRVAVINERLARRFWPAYPNGEDPVGQSILAGASPEPLQVVGIVADVRQAGLADEAGMGVYRPRAQTREMSAMFAVR